MIAKEPKFAQYLKNTMEKTATLEDPGISKVEGIASILETTLNSVIRLSESVMSQFNEVNQRLAFLENGNTGNGSVSNPLNTQPLPIYSTNPAPPPFLTPPNTPATKVARTPTARAAIINELQALFDKRNKLT